MTMQEKELTQISHETPTLRVVRRTIEVQQGNNTIHMTKTDVNALRMMKEEGKYDGCYVSSVEPRVKYLLLKDGSILATCRESGHDDVVMLSNKTMKWIYQFRESNRPRLAFDMDFIRQRRYLKKKIKSGKSSKISDSDFKYLSLEYLII